MRIATTTGDFSTSWDDYDLYTPDRSDIPKILGYLAECGFKYIDFNFCTTVYKGSPIESDDWQKWAENIGLEAERLGLKFVQAHSSDSCYNKGEERDYRDTMIKRQLEICKMLGIKGTVVHAICKPDGDRNDFIEKNVELYSELLETANKTGVEVYTENTCTNNCPTYFLVCAEDFHQLDKALGKPELFGCCWDVGHAHVQHVEQHDEIVALGDRLKAVHIHDNLSTGDFHMQLYTGNCNFDSVLMGLIDAKFNGYFTLEAFSIPAPKNFLGKKGYTAPDGTVFDKLRDYPLELKLRSERLMYDTARYMLKTYNCLDE